MSLGNPNDPPLPPPDPGLPYQGLAVAPDPSRSLFLSASGTQSTPIRHLSSASISGGRAVGFLIPPEF